MAGEMMDAKTIAEIAVEDGRFTTLVTALQAADLVETLQGEGPFTVFAPTDEAFAKLPKGTVVSLLKPENKKKLQAVLTYHVVPGRLTSAELARTRTLTTLGGQRLDVAMYDTAMWMMAPLMATPSRLPPGPKWGGATEVSA